MSPRRFKAGAPFVALAMAWSLSLVIGGLWTVLAGMEHWPAMFAALGPMGLAAIAAGQIVFFACVADRVFPGASGAVVTWMELLSCVMFFAGLVLAAYALLWPAWHL